MKITYEERERRGERPVVPFYSDVRACSICGAIDHETRECFARVSRALVAKRRALTPWWGRTTLR